MLLITLPSITNYHCPMNLSNKLFRDEISHLQPDHVVQINKSNCFISLSIYTGHIIIYILYCPLSSFHLTFLIILISSGPLTVYVSTSKGFCAFTFIHVYASWPLVAVISTTCEPIHKPLPQIQILSVKFPVSFIPLETIRTLGTSCFGLDQPIWSWWPL